MIFKLNFINPAILRGADLAQEFCETELGIILTKNSFTFTEQTPEQIFNWVSSQFMADVQAKNYVSISEIYPRWRFTKMNATTFKNIPRSIFFNAYKHQGRRASGTCGTIIHEYAGHIMGYGHGNNFNQGSVEKQNSFPIWIGNQAERWARGR